MSNNHFYTITGGPGSGKTTLINELKKRGYRCAREVARQIIQEQTIIGEEGVPWKDLKLFKELLLDRSIETYKAAFENREVTFFDRDVLELISYDRYTQTESSLELKEAVIHLTYNKKVFLAPPWKAIYCNDDERRQTYEESLEIYQHIAHVYREYGREVIELPKTSVVSRADFVISHLL